LGIAVIRSLLLVGQVVPGLACLLCYFLKENRIEISVSGASFPATESKFDIFSASPKFKIKSLVFPARGKLPAGAL